MSGVLITAIVCTTILLVVALALSFAKGATQRLELDELPDAVLELRIRELTAHRHYLCVSPRAFQSTIDKVDAELGRLHQVREDRKAAAS